MNATQSKSIVPIFSSGSRQNKLYDHYVQLVPFITQAFYCSLFLT